MSLFFLPMFDLGFPYTIRRSSRAKNIRVSIKNNTEVILVLPKLVPEFFGLQFLKNQKKWIEKNLISVSNYQEIPEKNYKTGTKIQLFGHQDMSLKIETSTKNSFELIDDVLYLKIKSKTPTQAEIKKLLTHFYKTQARQYITDQVDFFVPQIGKKYNKIYLKDNKTNWGSCSSKKNLNLNWRIIMAPIEIVDYLVIHEVCHLKEMNHSQKFWDLVESLDPNFKAHKKWLRENGKTLKI